MWIYFLCLILACVLYYFAQKDNPIPIPQLFLLLTFITLVLFAGLRDAQVGTDTSSYIQGFKNLAFSVEHHTSYKSSSEIGYLILQRIILLISSQSYAILIGISAISIFSVLWSIQKNSLLPFVSLFIYISLGYYTFFFNGARQGIAMSIYLLSFSALIQGKFWKYTLFVIIATLFHQTAIITLPVYFIVRRNFSISSLLILFLLSVAIFLSFNFLIAYGTTLESRYALFKTTQTSPAGTMLTLFYTLLSVFFIWFRQWIHGEELKKYDIFLNMMLLGTAVYLIVFFAHGYIELTRFAAYFQVASMFMWPIIFKNTSKEYLGILIGSFVILHLVFFYVFLGRIGDLTPYLFNQQLFLKS